MMTRYAAWLNKKGLAEIDPAIYILDIAYASPSNTVSTTDKPGRNGKRVLDVLARSTSVVITFEIHDQDTQRRQEICRRVQAWAMAGGVLTTRDRPGQRLCVICEDPPAISSALKWTQPLKITFTAYEQPFWEDEHPRKVVLNGSEANAQLYAPGIGVQTRVTASVSNVSGGVIDALTLKAGGTTFDFDGLSLGSGETLSIGYDEHDLLYIRVGDVSKLACRTAESDDDLMVTTGTAEKVSVIADGDVSVMMMARGLYL